MFALLLAAALAGCTAPAEPAGLVDAGPYHEEFTLRGYTVLRAVPCTDPSLCVNPGIVGKNTLDVEPTNHTTRLSAIVTWTANSSLTEEMSVRALRQDGERFRELGEVSGRSPLSLELDALAIDAGERLRTTVNWKRPEDRGTYDIWQDFNLVVTLRGPDHRS